MNWIERLHTARIHFIDREGTRDALQLYYDPAADPGALLTALSASGAFQDVSNAQEYAVLLKLTSTNADASAPTGDNLAVGAFVFQAGTSYGTIRIPGVRADLLLTTGCFAGIAIDLVNPAVQAFATAIGAAGAVTPAGTALAQLTAAAVEQQWSELTRRSG